MANTQVFDVAIIGGGHNGLVCAAYLAAAGLKVTVLERRSVVGGAAVTEEFHPGFRNSVASYTVSLLNPKVIRDLDLPGHGLKVVERRLANFLPVDESRYLLSGAGPDQGRDRQVLGPRCRALRFLWRPSRRHRRRAARHRAAHPAECRVRRLVRRAAGADQGRARSATGCASSTW